MKIGIITASLHMETKDALRKAKDIGAHGVQLWVVNNDLDPCVYGSKEDGKVKESGSGGWWIKVYRHITYPDGHFLYREGDVTTDEWVVHYEGSFKVVEYSTKKCKP